MKINLPEKNIKTKQIKSSLEKREQNLKHKK